mmetsp:Transcript_36942/g.74682  ORF Transcript_36942/g.74682 Transcript_36942/m.74682 type:complete len:182 (-) Transcript_36942:96-641(-)
MPIESVWNEEWGAVPDDFRDLDQMCKLIKGLASAISRHADSSDELAWLCPPNFLQLACFAGQGRGYVRHLDNPAHGNPDNPQFSEGVVGSRVCDRRVTAIAYFNDEWREEDGGCLRLFSPEAGREQEAVATLLPRAGRMVLFDSTRFFHEVQPAFRERWALSAWMTIPEDHPRHPLSKRSS